MKREMKLLTLFAALVLGTLASALRPAAGQDPGSLVDLRQVVDEYATLLTSCDLSGLAACTSQPFHDRLRPRLSACTAHQLGSFRRMGETALEPGLVQVTLLWTQSDGVLETISVILKKDEGRWVVAGGEVP